MNLLSRVTIGYKFIITILLCQAISLSTVQGMRPPRPQPLTPLQIQQVQAFQKKIKDLAAKLRELQTNLSRLKQKSQDLSTKLKAPAITPLPTPPPGTPDSMKKGTQPPPIKSLAQQIAELNALDPSTRTALIEKMSPQRLEILSKNIIDPALQELKKEIDNNIARKPKPSTPSKPAPKPTTPKTDGDLLAELQKGKTLKKVTSTTAQPTLAEKLRAATNESDRNAILEPLTLPRLNELKYDMWKDWGVPLFEDKLSSAEHGLVSTMKNIITKKEDAAWKALADSVSLGDDASLAAGLSKMDLTDDIRYVLTQATLLKKTKEIKDTIDNVDIENQTFSNLLTLTRAVINDSTKDISDFMQALHKRIIDTWLDQLATAITTDSETDAKKYLVATIELLNENRLKKGPDKVIFLPNPTETIKKIFDSQTDNKKAEELATAGLEQIKKIKTKAH